MKKDYSKFYISMIIILSFLLISTTTYNKYEMYKHLEKDLEFTNEITDFVIFEAKVIQYCAEFNNVTSEVILEAFLLDYANKIIQENWIEESPWAEWDMENWEYINFPNETNDAYEVEDE